MKTLKKYIHRFWFWLGFCPKEAKEIFLAASKESILYMCPAIIRTKEFMTFLDFDYACVCAEAAWYLRAYGFTRDNYLEYIEKYYPELLMYADRDNSAYWLGRHSIWPRGKHLKIYESKREFLKHLADKL